MDDLDHAIVDALQDGVAVCERPFATAAQSLGIGETALIGRLRRLLADGVLTRFGPMFDAERLGGAVTLAAMSVPPARLDAVAAQVNGFDEVAHNYEREHALNLWFVLATETPEAIPPVIEAIAARTGYPVYDMPKLEEYYVGLRFRTGGSEAPEKPGSVRSRDDPAGGRASDLRRTDAGGGSHRDRASGRGRGGAGAAGTMGAHAPATASRGSAVRRLASRGLDPVDRAIVAATQEGLPLVPRPCHAIAERIGLDPAQIMQRLQRNARHRRRPAHRSGAEPLCPRLPGQRDVGVERRRRGGKRGRPRDRRPALRQPLLPAPETSPALAVQPVRDGPRPHPRGGREAGRRNRGGAGRALPTPTTFCTAAGS